MSDEPLDESVGEPVAADDAHLRALLAGLGSGRGGETMPAEVVARLDDTLARLVAERDAAPPDEDQEPDEGRTDNVVPLRRRWAARAGAAAAAVIVIGVGGAAATHLGVFGSDSVESSSSSSTSSDSGAASAPMESGSQTPGTQTPGTQTPRGRGPDDPAAGAEALVGGTVDAADLPQVGPASFAADVESLLARPGSLRVPPRVPAGSAQTGPGRAMARDRSGSIPSSSGATPSCPGPRITDGGVPNEVSYDGTPAVLVVHPLRAGHRLVEAWDCAGSHRLDTATLTP